MPLMLDAMRVEFAKFLNAEPHGGRSIDDALRHVLTMTYERGLDDGRRCQPGFAHLISLCHNLLDPEMYGHAVSDEVRKAARQALGVTR